MTRIDAAATLHASAEPKRRSPRITLAAKPTRPRLAERLTRDVRLVPPTLRDQLRDAVAADSWPVTVIGPVGCGKSRAVLCLAERVEQEGMVKYFTVSDAWERYRECMSGNVQDGAGYSVTAAKWMRDWCEARLCVLDELGLRGDATPALYEFVYRLVNGRDGMPLIIVSNVSLDEIERTYDYRVRSRMEAGTVIEFDGPDLRIGGAR